MPKTKYKKRKDGRYTRNIIVGYREDGSPDRRNVYGRTIQELEASVAQFREDMRQYGVPSKDKYTLGEWAMQYFSSYRSTPGGENYADLRQIKNYILPWPKSSIDIKKIKLLDLQNLLNPLGNTRTAQMLRSLFVRIYDAALENSIVSINIARKLPKIDYSPNQTRTLTELEEFAILKADFTPEERAFVYSILFAGLRRGEVLALIKNGNQKTVDLQHNLLTVDKNLVFPQKQNKGVLKLTPKTDAGFRTNPIITPLRAALGDCVDAKNGTEFLFVNSSSEIHSRTSYRYLWRNIVKKMNVAVATKENPEPITGIRSHMLRHTFCTYLAVVGVPPSIAQKLMGHSDIAMTIKVYTHLPLVNRYVHSPIFHYYKEFLSILMGSQKTPSIKGKKLYTPSKLTLKS